MKNKVDVDSKKKHSTLEDVLSTIIDAVDNGDHYIVITQSKVQTTFEGLGQSFIKDLSDLLVKHAALFNHKRASH